MPRPLIVSLFDYSGHWPFYFARNGYDVIQVDLKHGDDVLTWQPPLHRRVYGVLAAPPCTHLANSGGQYFKAKDRDGRTQQACDLVIRTLEIVDLVRPSFWILENPEGRMRKLLGPPVHAFNPCDYAGYAPDPRSNAYTKKTLLWGNFELPRVMPVPPVYFETNTGKRGSFLWYGSKGMGGKRSEARSQTPLGFSYATYLANRDPHTSNLSSFPRVTYSP